VRPLVPAAWCAILAGCSSASIAEVDASVDAASGPQPVGAACDPAISVPCIPTGDPCLGVTCDPVALICVAYVSDAGAVCGGGTAPCATTADCDVGLACGFPVGGGCGAKGVCINAPVDCQSDAAACGAMGSACGCDGLTVPVLIPGYAAAPASSLGECGPDAGRFFDGSADDGEG
jgi:hypothetical protein